jgi:O-antigen/teichoic acid export membrane protein
VEPSEETAERDRADARHAARGGAAQLLTILAQALIAATQVVFARLYGQVVYGSYVSTLAVLDVLNRGGTGGADKAMLRYVAAARAAGDAAGVKSAIGTGLRLGMAVGGCFGIALACAAPLLAIAFKAPTIESALRILAPLPLLTGALWILIQASLAARVTRANFYVRGLAEPSLLLFGGVLGWLVGGGLRALTTAHVSACLATLVLAIFLMPRVFSPNEIRGVLAAPRLRGLVSFSLPMAAGEMLNAVVQRADLVILTTLNGLEAAAVYGAVEFLTRSIANIRYAFDSILAGVLSETLHLGELARLRYNLQLATRWVLSIAAPITVTLIVLRHDLLVVLFGRSYGTGGAALVALAASHLVNASLGLTGWVLMVAGRSRLGLYNNLVCAVFNLCAAYFLTKRFGLPGAACAALGTSLLMQGIIQIEVAWLEKVHAFSTGLLKPIAATAIMLAVEWPMQSFIAAPWVRLPLVIAAGAAVYGMTLWALRLPEEERRIFDRALRVLRPGRIG